MRFLADENVPQELIDTPLQNQIDILSVRPGYSGITDEEVVNLSNVEERTIISFDKGFGKLIFQKGISPKNGLILIRDYPVEPKLIANSLIEVFKKSNAEYFENSILVLERDFIKQRKF